MRVLTIVFVAISLILLGVSIQAALKSNSAVADSLLPPAARTGGPGETTCNTCHLGNVGTPDGGVVIYPADGVIEYAPGVTDTIAIVVGDLGQSRWGFEATILKNSDNTAAGTIASMADPPFWTSTQSSGGKTYISHTSNGNTTPPPPPDLNDGTFWGQPGGGWAFEWTAPPPGTGPVTIFVAGVAADGDGTANGSDYTYTNTLVLQEAGTSPVSATTWGKIKKRYH